MFIRSPEELAIQIKNQRKQLKLSQVQAAEEVGLKQKTISALENNPGATQIETLFRILSALGLNMYLLPKDQTNNNEWKEEW
jgi:HTH-type transcriptional regulator/antitoxin HipB